MVMSFGDKHGFDFVLLGDPSFGDRDVLCLLVSDSFKIFSTSLFLYYVLSRNQPVTTVALCRCAFCLR
jgi:hypothetical protein